MFKGTRNLFIAFVVLLLAILMVFGVYSLTKSSSSTKTLKPGAETTFTNAFMVSLSNGKVDETYGNIDSNMRDKYSFESWAALVKSVSTYYPKTWTQTKVTSVEDPAKVYENSSPRKVYYTQTISGKKYEIRVVVITTDKVSKIDDIQWSEL